MNKPEPGALYERLLHGAMTEEATKHTLLYSALRRILHNEVNLGLIDELA